VDAKAAGVLTPFLKIPALVDRIEAVVSAAGGTADGALATGERRAYRVRVRAESRVRQRQTETDVVSQSYAKISAALFNLCENVALTKPKYQDIVRLENYYFFTLTVGARKVCGGYVGGMWRVCGGYEGGMWRVCGVCVCVTAPLLFVC
jgi:hypothetical protein